MIKIDSRKVLKLIVSILVSLIFVYLFNRYIGFDKLVNLFKNLTPVQILSGFSLYLLSYIVRTLRWRLTLDIDNFKKLFKITVFNTFFNIILPFRVGELSFFYMLKREGISLPQTTLSFITTRIFDGLSLLGIFSMFYFIHQDNPVLAVVTFLASPILFVPIILLLKLIKHQQIIDYHSKWKVLNLIKIYTLSVLTVILKFLAFFAILPKSIDISLPLSFLAFSVADLTTVLPLHGIAGIGTYESGFAATLILFGIDKQLAFLSATVIHIFILLSSSLLAISTFLLFKRL